MYLRKVDKRYYDINGLVTFSIEGEKSKLDYIDRQYFYFRKDYEIKDVDIKVHVGKFDRNRILNSDYSVVNRKYFINGDAIYSKDTYKVAKWEFMIDGLSRDRTSIYFDGNCWGYIILYKFFVEPIIRMKLCQKGYFMIHSSSVCVNNQALVFPASPSVGKTSTMLNWLHDGMSFISDEYTILDSQQVYSYPTPLRLHDYNLKANPYVCEDMSFHNKAQIYIRTWIFRLTFGYGDVTHEVNIWDIFSKVKIVNTAPLGQIVIFTKYNGSDVKINHISRERLIEKLLIIDRFETTRFNDYLDAYYYVNNTHPEDQFWNRMKSIAEGIFTEDEYIELNIPAHYNETSFKQINVALGQ